MVRFLKEAHFLDKSQPAGDKEDAVELLLRWRGEWGCCVACGIRGWRVRVSHVEAPPSSSRQTEKYEISRRGPTVQPFPF